MSDAVNEFNKVLRTQKTISIKRLIKLRRSMGVVNSRKVEELEEENKRYRELLEMVIDNGQCASINYIANEIYKEESK